MVYGLTDRRLLIVSYLAFGAVKSFEPREIDRLIVDDYNRRGDVIFRKADRDRFSLRPPWDPGDALVGVDDPEGVARLIQSTLRRNTPIEHVGKTRR